jgi:hypothetical protein
MFLNLYSLVSRDLSGTGILTVAFASVLGMLLIRDARADGQPLNQQTRNSRPNKSR